MTQAQLGDLLLEPEEPGTAAPRISRYERGMHKPDLDTLERLAELLDLPAAYFVTKSELVAEAVLLISQLPARRQKEAVDLLKQMVTSSKR